jgi:tetratricopeptide (TPR) repeat protein
VQLRKAILVDSANPQAHLNLSTCLKSQGRVDEAIEELRTLIGLDPDQADSSERGYVIDWLTELGRLDEAIAEGREAVRLNPRSFELHLSLGYALHAVGRLEEACEMCRKWLRHGTPWRLAEEIASMHTPAPITAAFAPRQPSSCVRCSSSSGSGRA